MFNLAALGAGLGQFAQDYRQQQAQQERNMMLAMQLANFRMQQNEWQRKQKDLQDQQIVAGVDPYAAGGSGGLGPTPTAPIGGGGMPNLPGTTMAGPRGPSLAGPMPPPRSAGGFAPPGFATPGAQPNFPTRQTPQGQPVAWTADHRTAANTPPDKLSDFGPGSPYGAKPPDQMTTPAQAAFIAGDLSGKLTAPGGTQMAQAGPGEPMPQPPKESVGDIAKMLRDQLNAAGRSDVGSAVIYQQAAEIFKRQAEKYKTDLNAWHLAQQEARAGRTEQREQRAEGRAETAQERSGWKMEPTAEGGYARVNPGSGQMQPMQQPPGTTMLPPSASGHIFRAPDGSYYDSSGRKIPVPEGATMTGGAGSRAPKSILVKDAEGNVTFSGLATQLAPDEWVDAGGEHVDTKGMKVTPLSGASGVTAANMNQRIMYGANEVQRAIDNMTQMPIGSTLGWFGGAQAQTAKTLRDGLTKGLANTITPRSAQMMAAMARGIDRGLAQLAGAGAAQGLQALSEQMKGEIPAAGDDGFTVLTKFANMRQIIEASNETLQANDLIGDKQKALMETVTQRVRKSVPWTVSDVVAITSDPSEERIRDFAAKIGVAGAKGGEGGATGARYNPGDVIDKGGKKYRVTGGNPSDPDVEEIK